MVETLVNWPRVRERVPFDAAAYNRLINWFNGALAAPMAWVDDTGALMMSENPSIPKITFFAPVEFVDTVLVTGTFRLANTLYLYSRNAADSADIGLIRLNASNIIELGPTSSQRLTIVSPLTNATNLNGRNVANNANIALIGLTALDIIQIGPGGGQRITLAGSLTNNTGLFGRDSTNTVDVLLIGMNAANQILVGAVGTSTFLTGTVVAPAIDPPTINGQVTAESQLAGSVLFSVSGGVVTLLDSYNVSAVAYLGVGIYRVDWNRDFANTTYRAVVTTTDATASFGSIAGGGRAVGSTTVVTWDAAGALVDVDEVTVIATGTLS